MNSDESALEYVTAIDPDRAKIPPRAEGRVARISVLLGPNEGKTYKLMDGSIVGRAADAAVRLQDRGVSRRHARFQRVDGDRFALEDLGSRNGTLVNGHQVGRAVLEPGDRIQLGSRCLLLFSVHDDLEESMVNAKKIEIIGRLSAGINHDFNNLLCVVLSNAAYLLELPNESMLSNKEVRECLEDIRAAAQSGAELTHRLGTLAQTTNVAQESVNLSQLCEETMAILRDTFPKAARIQAHVQPGIWVRGVRGHLRQLLLNPCLNARDAMPDGGTLSVEAVLKEPHELESTPLLKADCYAVLTFTDTGRGMNDEVLRSAFEPFFTTKEIELGRGLGLPMVRKVAADHGGTVQLWSELGVGTTLRIVLPVAEVDEQQEDDGVVMNPSAGPAKESWPSAAVTCTLGAVSAPPAELKAQRRVLLAEDDEGLGRAFVRSLRRAGYDVVWVADGERATAAMADEAAKFDLVLLDLDIADGSGSRAHGLIRKRERELPMVLLSGASDAENVDAAAQMGSDTRVHKPVEPAVLARVVQLALRRAGRGSRP
jgi:signal transduction histidine kinase/ActR/RegA family two-component response regulator